MGSREFDLCTKPHICSTTHNEKKLAEWRIAAERDSPASQSVPAVPPAGCCTPERTEKTWQTTVVTQEETSWGYTRTFGTYVFGQRAEGAVRAGQSPQQCDGRGAEHQRCLDQLAQRCHQRPELQRHRLLHRILLVVGLRGVACTAERQQPKRFQTDVHVQ